MSLKNEIYKTIVQSIDYKKGKFKKRRNIFVWEHENICKQFSIYKSKYSTDKEIRVRVEWEIYVKQDNGLLNKIYDNKNNTWCILLGTMDSFNHTDNCFLEIDTINQNHAEKNVIEKMNHFINNDLYPFFQQINSLVDIISIIRTSSQETIRWHDPISKSVSEDNTIAQCYLLLGHINQALTYLYDRKHEIEKSDLLPGKKKNHIQYIDELLGDIKKL